jgi:hypothetical protein
MSGKGMLLWRTFEIPGVEDYWLYKPLKKQLGRWMDLKKQLGRGMDRTTAASDEDGMCR